MLSCNTRGARIIWLCADTNLGLGLRVEQLGTPRCRHVLSAGSFKNTNFWNNFFFCVKEPPASHRRAVHTWDRPQSYHTRSWAMKYLDHCLCPTAADPGAQQVASAMQYLAQPWFLHQCAVLGASLMVSYRGVLDDVVRQSRHWHSLLRRARVWTTSADEHYQRHNRRIQLFSVMSQLWVSESTTHQVESPLPKRHMAPTKRRKLLTGEWHTRDPACLNPLKYYTL